jgi:hypothetical protein
MAGNFYDCNIQMGRYDADFGTVLINKGKGNFEALPLSIPVKGQVRRIAKVKIKNGDFALVFAKNDAAAQIFRRNL